MKPQTAVKLSASAQYLIKNVRYWHFSDIPPALTNVRYRGDCVAKVGGTRLLRNNRIQGARRLNQSCATD